MWIRSQDKKKLIKVDSFELKKNMSSRVIYGWKSGRTIGESEIALGKYATEEDALRELDKIEKHLMNNTNEVYQMS